MQSRDPFDISIELQVKILKRGSIKAKEALVKKVKLNQDVEIVLLQHTGFDFAMKYIQRHSLSPKAQEFLVCKGSEALAMYFIDHNDLCPTAKILLVMQGNHDKIMAMLQNKQRLDGTIAKALLKRRNKEEIEQYLRNQYPKLLPLK